MEELQSLISIFAVAIVRAIKLSVTTGPGKKHSWTYARTGTVWFRGYGFEIWTECEHASQLALAHGVIVNGTTGVAVRQRVPRRPVFRWTAIWGFSHRWPPGRC